MQLLSKKKIERERAFESDEKRIASLKIQRKRLEEEKKLSDAFEDWEPEKKRLWKEFAKWNQNMQTKKALIIQEIEELEKKRDSLIDTIRIHL